MTVTSSRPSTVKLPAVRPAGATTVYRFFLERFPRIPEPVWRERFGAGRVWTAAGPVGLDSPYVPGVEVHYLREVESEPPVRTDWRPVWRDDELVVVDKPPFLPVTPGGRWVRGCLLELVAAALGETEVAPLHRIDRLTSGLVVMSRRRATRGHWGRLFQGPCPRLRKRYLAACEVRCDDLPERMRLAHCLRRSPTEYWRQEVVPGEPANARADLELLDRHDDLALVRLELHTGRKHQLRVQLAHVGLPVLGDPLYGVRPRHDPADLSERLWLDASELTVDGWTGPDGGVPLTATWRSREGEEAFAGRALTARARVAALPG